MAQSEDTGVKKRKLSVGAGAASEEGQIKRVKSQRDDEPDGAPEHSVSPKAKDRNEASGTDADGSDGSDSGSANDDEERPKMSDEKGPAVFYLYGDGLMSVIEEEEVDWPLIRLKSSVNRAWTDLVARHGISDPKVPDHEDWDYAQDMAHWHIFVKSEAKRDTLGAQELKKIYDAIMDKERELGDSENHWWYEVTMQRQKPEDEAAPALEVKMDWDDGYKRAQVEGRAYEGVWWITAIKWANEQDPALKYFGNNIPYVNPNP